MKLHHRMLRHFIAASVIVLTSSFLIFELVASDRAMSAYLRYIVQKADSSFLYDKYQNQITEITDSTAENLVLYAKFLDESTISQYTVEYYKQKEDESGYDLVTEDTERIEAIIGTEVSAEEKEYDGYILSETQ